MRPPRTHKIGLHGTHIIIPDGHDDYVGKMYDFYKYNTFVNFVIFFEKEIIVD